MTLASLLRRALFGSPRATSRSGRVCRATLHLECLEDRAVPTAGALDPTFGTGGKVTHAASARAVALQADGKIVTAGSGHTVTRFNTDGTLDMSFGVGGRATIELGPYDVAFAVAVQADNKIVAAGMAWNDATQFDCSVVRYNADGTPDATFGFGGFATTSFSSVNQDEQANSVVIQPDGKIVLGGYARGNNTGEDFALVRYNANGTLDASFGSGGKVLTNFVPGARGASPSDEVITALALQADGKIVAAGFSSGATLWDFALARYNLNGTLDTSFDGDGKVKTDFGSAPNKKGTVEYPGYDFAYGVAIQPDGKVVLAGTTSSSQLNDATSNNFALARFNVNGSLDASFGTGGKVTTDFGGRDMAKSIAIQTIAGQLKIVVGGYAGSDTNRDFALARYNVNGTLDATFGTGGKVTTDFGSGNDEIRAIAIQADGKVVAVGTAEIAGAYQLALARYESV